MTDAVASDHKAWAIPPRALAEWLELCRQVEEIGAVPCRTSDPEAWWPARNEVSGLPARMAVAACWSCGAREACLEYAVAADEREGIWGATLPQERRGARRNVA